MSASPPCHTCHRWHADPFQDFDGYCRTLDEWLRVRERPLCQWYVAKEKPDVDSGRGPDAE